MQKMMDDAERGGYVIFPLDYYKLCQNMPIFYVKFMIFLKPTIIVFNTVTSATFGSKTSGTHMITNGICSFSPTSTKGKWIFMIQTIVLSFAPIVILLAQNGASFYEIMMEKEHILQKNALVI